MSDENMVIKNTNSESYLLSVVLVTGASTFINKIQKMSPSTEPGEIRKIIRIYINHLEELYQQTN